MGMLERIELFINRLLISAAAGFLLLMILLTCANIFLRLIWKPIPGTFEMLGLVGAITAAWALGYTQSGKGHIAVDILVERFSAKTQKFVALFNHLVCMTFFSIVAWHICKYAWTLLKTQEVTETLQIVYYPFVYGVALGCTVLGLVFLGAFLKTIYSKGEVKK